jgi:Ca2+-binding EF-hand superfamily protein
MTRRELMAALAAVGAVCTGNALAQMTTASPKSPNVSLIAEQNVKQLLLLMDTDKNGKISKHEWMEFMSTEFDRLDTDHSGELDPKELLQSSVQVHPVSSEVLGK